jgi:hypothetical protein
MITSGHATKNPHNTIWDARTAIGSMRIQFAFGFTKMLIPSIGSAKANISKVAGVGCMGESLLGLSNDMAFCCERLTTNIAASERQRARRFRKYLRSSAATPG